MNCSADSMPLETAVAIAAALIETERRLQIAIVERPAISPAQQSRR